MDGIDEVVNRADEGQAAGVYGADFAVGSLTGIGAKNGLGGLRIEVGSNKDRRVVESNSGEMREQIAGSQTKSTTASNTSTSPAATSHSANAL